MRIFEPGNMFPGFAFDPVTAATTALSVGSNLIGSKMKSDASKSAANTQSSSDAAAIAEQRRQFDSIKQLEAPFVGAGTNSVNQLQWLLGLGNPGTSQAGPGGAGAPANQTPAGEISSAGFYALHPELAVLSNPADKAKRSQMLTEWQNQQAAANQATSTAAASTAGPYPGGDFGSLSKPFSAEDFKVDPGYEFALEQGQRALQRTQAANGQLQSGAAAKAMTDYSEGVANQQYGAAYDRYNTNQSNLYNRLMGLTNVGQSAASMQANAGQTMANNVSDLTTNSGNSQAAGQLGSSAAWQTGLSNIGNLFTGNSNSGINVGTQSGLSYGPITWN